MGSFAIGDSMAKEVNKIKTLKMEDLSQTHYTSTRLEYRPFEPADCKDVYEYGKDAESCRFLMWGPYKNITEAEASVKNKIAESDLQWVIVEKEEKKVIGTIRLYDYNVKDRSGAASYILNRNYTGHGYMLESLQFMFGIAPKIMPIDILYTYYDVENEKSRNVMIKAGMISDDFYEEQMVIKGQLRTFKRYYKCLKE